MRDGLGLDHPLTRACDALDLAVRQLLVVAAMLCGSVAAAAEGAPWGRSSALAAAVVLIGTGTLAALRAQARRDCAIDLVIAGVDRGVPVSVVQRERRRLARPRTRHSIARTFELMIEETVCRGRPVPLSSRPLLHAQLIAAVQSEMRAIAGLLRSDGATVRGVALCERLVTMGESPLYGRDLTSLRSELHRARFVLSGS